MFLLTMVSYEVEGRKEVVNDLNFLQLGFSQRSSLLRDHQVKGQDDLRGARVKKSERVIKQHKGHICKATNTGSVMNTNLMQ